jgi:signal transduction histidine kinase
VERPREEWDHHASLTRAPAGEDDAVQKLQHELERRTRALERSEARFRDVIERNADAIVVVDSQGLIRFTNDRAITLFGGTRAALIGKPFGFPLVKDETTELDLLTDGAPRVAEMRVVESEWEGRTAYIASLRDVTERKRAEQGARDLIREQAARTAAEASAKRFRFLSESGAALTSSLNYQATLAALARVCVTGFADWAEVYAVEADGMVRRLETAHCEPARAALVGTLRGVVIPPKGSHPVLAVIRTRTPMLASTLSPELRASMIVDEGHERTVTELGMTSLIVIPMMARDRVLGAIALFSSDPRRRFNAEDLALAEDVGARAALAVDNALLYEEARRANQTKADFLAVVSHDLRTPLNAIMGYAELMGMGIPEPLPEAARERLHRIRTAAGHLLYLLDELLGFARLEAGREEVHPRDVDVREVVREMEAVIEPLAHSAHLGFAVDVPATPVTVRTDPDKLRQILVNLGGNAVKYTPRGEVRVVLREQASKRVVIQVTDTGIGIAPEHLHDIFEPFWQVNEGQRSANGGTGLGLSVVRGLVRLLGGEVSVESQPGKGSAFTVVIGGLRSSSRNEP